MREPPVAYVASGAMTAVAMRGVKGIVYGTLLDLDRDIRPLAIALSGAMVAGSRVGKRVIERLPVARFRLLVAGLLAVAAVQTIVTG